MTIIIHVNTCYNTCLSTSPVRGDNLQVGKHGEAIKTIRLKQKAQDNNIISARKELMQQGLISVLSTMDSATSIVVYIIHLHTHNTDCSKYP